MEKDCLAFPRGLSPLNPYVYSVIQYYMNYKFQSSQAPDRFLDNRRLKPNIEKIIDFYGIIWK